ncbi:MAG: tetratricopeptide repeat protein [Polyangiaceae bacterium]|nr:tetratricopeptide repeat protein [Polyangiaceae bacterium]
MTRRFTWLPLSLIVVGGPALADTRDPAAADALFREARALLKQKNFDAACPKLAESLRLDPAPGTLFNLAECEEGRGRVASAHERWQRLVDTLTSAGKLTDDRLPIARQRLAALEKKLPKLTIRLKKAAPPGTVVVRDGVELRAAGLDVALPVDPGEHVIVARAPSHKDAEARVSLVVGESRSIEVAPGAAIAAAPAPASSSAPAQVEPAASAAEPPPSPPSAHPSRTTGYAVAGVGALGLVGAGITGLMLSSKQGTVDDHCDKGGRVCDQQGLDAASSGKSLLKVNTALWAVGLVGVGVGTYLILRRGPSGEARTALGVHAAPGAATLSVKGALP